MKRPMDGSAKKNIFFLVFITFSLLAMNTLCCAKNIHDILKPTKNTFDWLDRLEALDSLENAISNQQDNLPNESLNWVKIKTRELRYFSEFHVTEQFSVKPAKVKSRPLKLSEVSDYYALENVGETNEQTGTQRGYGLKFNFEFK